MPKTSLWKEQQGPVPAPTKERAKAFVVSKYFSPAMEKYGLGRANGNIPQSTIYYVEKVWNLLKQVTSHVMDLPGNAAFLDTPPLSKLI